MLSFSSSTRLDLMDHGGSARKNRATAKLVKWNVAGAGHAVSSGDTRERLPRISRLAVRRL